MSKTKSRISLLCFFALGFLLLGNAHDASAQVLYGSVSGTITDQSGAGVPKSHVTVTNRATGVVREADADDNGYYRITDVPPGETRSATSASRGDRFSIRPSTASSTTMPGCAVRNRAT